MKIAIIFTIFAGFAVTYPVANANTELNERDHLIPNSSPACRQKFEAFQPIMEEHKTLKLAFDNGGTFKIDELQLKYQKTKLKAALRARGKNSSSITCRLEKWGNEHCLIASVQQCISSPLGLKE